MAPYALQGEGLVTTKGLLQAHHNTLTGMKVKAGLGTREGDARAQNNPGGRRPQPFPIATGWLRMFSSRMPYVPDYLATALSASVPSDHLRTRTRNTVIGSGAP